MSLLHSARITIWRCSNIRGAQMCSMRKSIHYSEHTERFCNDIIGSKSSKQRWPFDTSDEAHIALLHPSLISLTKFIIWNGLWHMIPMTEGAQEHMENKMAQ